MSLAIRSRTQELIDEVHLSLTRHLRGVAGTHFTVYAEHVLLHSEQSLFDVLLIRLVEPFTVCIKLVIVP